MTRFTTTALKLGAVSSALFASMGCDYSGDWLFPGVIEDVPGIIHVSDPDDDLYLTPSEATTADELRASAIYGELGPAGGVARGGMTVNFLGTGGPICVFVDPETVFWNWSVAPNPSAIAQPYAYPDNVYDDGDLDVTVGLSAHYTGSPGVEIGDFEVSYTDSLGNEIPLELSVCTNVGWRNQTNAHAGRGFPEMCNIEFTDPGVSYTAVMKTFATPLDDDRLGYGMLLYAGECDDMIAMAGAGGSNNAAIECLLTGESIFPAGDPGPWIGYDGARAWNGSELFEQEFCLGEDADMRKFCRKEANTMEENGIECETNEVLNADARCYCGDPNDIPEPGAL